MRNLQSLRLQLFSRTLFTVGLVTLLMIDAFALQNNNEADTTKETTTIMSMKNSITHGEQENQDGHREEHKYSESLGKREKYLLANRSCKMLLDSLFPFIWDRIS
uniref:Uncharacterized protein n=1 Tax=Brassica campestris TaxID=3711 RepID=A0A3P6B685_BRACM|nr:unnamed protein product [Brassica rapa]